MDRNEITPTILTYNEEANLRLTLERLQWSPRVVVVDSFSDDKTLEIARSFSNVEVVQRPFDNHSSQANFALEQVKTEWALSLDADYHLPDDFPDLVERLDGKADGYSADFCYCVYGNPLRAALYPRRTVLYRRNKGKYVQDGHTQRVKVFGVVAKLGATIRHDDRKPLGRWFSSQVKYAELEAEKLLCSSELGWKDRIRKTVVIAPILTFFYCLIGKCLILNGWQGIFYTLQRVVAELLLALTLLEQKLQQK